MKDPVGTGNKAEVFVEDIGESTLIDEGPGRLE